MTTPEDSQSPTAAPTVKAVLDAQQSGYDAGWEGKAPTVCPFEPGDPLLHEWTAGWAAARTDAREDAGLTPGSDQ